MVTVDDSVCTGCKECVNSCPAEYLVLTDGKAATGDGDCLGCQSCAAVCPSGAITVEEY